MPEAMAISSTTFSSLRSTGSDVPVSTSRPPSSSAITRPPPLSWAILYRLPPPTTTRGADDRQDQEPGVGDGRPVDLAGLGIAAEVAHRAGQQHLDRGHDREDRKPEQDHKANGAPPCRVLALKEVGGHWAARNALATRTTRLALRRSPRCRTRAASRPCRDRTSRRSSRPGTSACRCCRASRCR